MKELACSHQILPYCDPNKEFVVQCDASEFGLGAVLRQDNKPVSFTCRALTDAGIRYEQIDKELLAIAFSLERFH